MNDIMIAVSSIVLLVLLLAYIRSVWPKRGIEPPWKARDPWEVDQAFFKWEEEHEVSKCACPRPYPRRRHSSKQRRVKDWPEDLNLVRLETKVKK